MSINQLKIITILNQQPVFGLPTKKTLQKKLTALSDVIINSESAHSLFSCFLETPVKFSLKRLK